MKNTTLMPCANWLERLTMSNHNDRSYVDCVALNEHLALCSACASAHSMYQTIGSHIASLPPVTPLDSLPYELLQQVQSSASRKAQMIAALSSILMWLTSLLVAFTLIFQKASYVSDSRYCYALQDTSGFLLWKYKKSDVFFFSPAVKDGVAYLKQSDAPLFQFSARVRPCGSSFLWR